MPRVNVAWNIDGDGNNVLRGGYGMFVNRPMGNVEYDTTLRVAARGLRTGVTPGDVPADFAGGHGLNYDTLRFVDGYQRAGGGAISVNSPSIDNDSWPVTHSYSVSYARRIPWGQVIEAAYVGTRGRDLVSRTDGNSIPLGGMMTGGVIGNADMQQPAASRGGRDLGRQHVPAVPGLLGRHALRLPRRDRLQLAAGDVEPADQQQVLVLRHLHVRAVRGLARRRVRLARPDRPEPVRGRARERPHPHLQLLVERVAARSRSRTARRS